jgi:hypothetical protein
LGENSRPGDGTDHEGNKHARNAKPLDTIHFFKIELFDAIR